MTKRELMEQKTQAILNEVTRMNEAIARMEKELRDSEAHPHLDTNGLVERCEELHARLEDIRNIVDESRRRLAQSTEEVEEPDLWL